MKKAKEREKYQLINLDITTKRQDWFFRQVVLRIRFSTTHKIRGTNGLKNTIYNILSSAENANTWRQILFCLGTNGAHRRIRRLCGEQSDARFTISRGIFTRPLEYWFGRSWFTSFVYSRQLRIMLKMCYNPVFFPIYMANYTPIFSKTLLVHILLVEI